MRKANVCKQESRFLSEQRVCSGSLPRRKNVACARERGCDRISENPRVHTRQNCVFFSNESESGEVKGTSHKCRSLWLKPVIRPCGEYGGSTIATVCGGARFAEYFEYVPQSSKSSFFSNRMNNHMRADTNLRQTCRKMCHT